MNKSNLITDLNTRILSCSRCELRENSTCPVPGIGSLDADYFLIGEAPGREEDEAGIPFIGMAGQRLDQLIELAGIDKNKCYFSNVCRCRPPKNRDPRKKEIKACKEFLMEEIRIIKPQTLITLGATPLGLFSSYGVGQLHGTSFEFEMEDF